MGLNRFLEAVSNLFSPTWCTFCLHILHFRNSVVMGLNRFLEAVSNLFSPTFLPPGFVVLLAPAFQGSGVITFPSLPFFSHFSQTILSISPNCSRHKIFLSLVEVNQ